MKRANLQVEMLPIEALTEYENNARAHGREDIEAIEWSIQQFGFNDPIGIWSTDNVIAEDTAAVNEAALKSDFKRMSKIKKEVKEINNGKSL